MISVTISATEHAVVCIHFVLVIDDIQKATAECMACWLYSVMFWYHCCHSWPKTGLKEVLTFWYLKSWESLDFSSWLWAPCFMLSTLQALPAGIQRMDWWVVLYGSANVFVLVFSWIIILLCSDHLCVKRLVDSSCTNCSFLCVIVRTAGVNDNLWI